MNKGILKSKRMIGMIISLAAGAVIMLGFAVYMFIFASNADTVYFDFYDVGSFEERLEQSRVILYMIAVGNLLIAAEKIVPFIASILMYKRYPDTKGLKVLKGVAIAGTVFYCLLFAGLFVWSFIYAFQDGKFNWTAFRNVMMPTLVVLFPALKFISLTMTTSSVQKNVSNGVILLAIVTAILIVGNFMSAIDALAGAYMFINLNAAAIFMILAAENQFLFLMTRKYLIMLAEEKKKISDSQQKEKA